MKLQPLLEEYLVENGSLPLADIGLLSIEKNAATVVVSELEIKPPQIEIIFSAADLFDEELQTLSEFIRQRLSVCNEQATQLLSSDDNIKSLVKDSGSFELPLFGILQNENGVITFKQAKNLDTYLAAIPLPKKLQQTELQPVDEVVLKPEKPVESLMPTEPIEESIEPELIQKDYWLVWAIIIFAVSIVLILFRYIQ